MAGGSGTSAVVIRRTLPVVLLVLLTSALATVASAYGTARDCPPMRLVAHRGIGPPGAENTIAAFRQAHRLGFRAVETDVRISADEKFVLAHDKDLRRTAGRADRVARLRSAELRKVRTRGGHRLVGLKRALRWADAHDQHVILHLKYDRDRPWTVGRLARLTRVVGSVGMSERVTYLSFSARVLRTLHLWDETTRTAWIPDDRPTVEEAQRTADQVVLPTDQIDPGYVRAARQAGVQTAGAAVRHPSELAGLGRAGVVHAMTDDLPPQVARDLSRLTHSCPGPHGGRRALTGEGAPEPST